MTKEAYDLSNVSYYKIRNFKVSTKKNLPYDLGVQPPDEIYGCPIDLEWNVDRLIDYNDGEECDVRWAGAVHKDLFPSILGHHGSANKREPLAILVI